MENLSKKMKEGCMLWMTTVGASVVCTGKRLRCEQRGQGTTEYAILVGVLVVIAIIAVVAFRGNLEQLWESITSSINQL